MRKTKRPNKKELNEHRHYIIMNKKEISKREHFKRELKAVKAKL